MEIRCAIVDDNRRDLQKISDTVTQLSFEARCRFIISAFLTGEDRLFSENYDLYIFDIDLPEQNGFQLASRLFTENKNATVVFCTNQRLSYGLLIKILFPVLRLSRRIILL